jgi:hypothetical protein
MALDPPAVVDDEALALPSATCVAPVGDAAAFSSLAVHHSTYDITLSFLPRGKTRAACSAVGGPAGTTGLAISPILEKVQGATCVCWARAPVERPHTSKDHAEPLFNVYTASILGHAVLPHLPEELLESSEHVCVAWL